jgi:hypothetical protein
LSFKPAPNAFGAAKVEFTLYREQTADYPESRSQPHLFHLELAPVNDPPYFTAGPDISITPGSIAYQFKNWANGISAGAPNESSDNLTFELIPVNPDFFSIKPHIDLAGTLTFTPSAEAAGISTVEVRLKDKEGLFDLASTLGQAITFEISISDKTAGIVISSIRSNAETVTLTWNTQAGTKYQVMFKDALNDGQWTNLSSTILGNGQNSSFTDTLTPENKRFYIIMANEE